MRPAHPGEAQILTDIALRSKAQWGYDAEFMAACAKELTVSEDDIAHDDIWVVELGTGEPVGFAHTATADGVLEVLLFFVSPDHVGAGHGTRLWQILERRALAQGCTAIGLDADPYSVGFYRRMGLVVEGEAASRTIPDRMLPRMIMRFGD